MQKTKRVILICLKNYGTCDRFKIRKYFAQTTKPTNSSELIRHLDSLEKAGCVYNVKGNYTFTKTGSDLLNLLVKVDKILSL